jgi:predicted nucleic acid-binding Zn ribbon protein
MVSITTLTPLLADIVRRQPSSPARTTFAWQLAVGPALAKSTDVELTDGVLVVRSADPRWTTEVHRARSVVLARLQHLLGDDCVRSLHIASEPTRFRSS